uniref:Uncharacterized protein n=1 Tax=Janibacter limosus TaxID=53458 RepID=A0AC61U146_9MICO|nr:alpha-isopropylmalate synthase regulatory domain-containing protein [Janibacter limosus]
MSGLALWDVFNDEYLHSEDRDGWGRFQPVRTTLSGEDSGLDRIEGHILDNGREIAISGSGNGPIAAFLDALAPLGIDVRVLGLRRARPVGRRRRPCGVVRRVRRRRAGAVGVGLHDSIVKASLRAILSAVNRAERDAAQV